MITPKRKWLEINIKTYTRLCSDNAKDRNFPSYPQPRHSDLEGTIERVCRMRNTMKIAGF